MLTHPVRTSTDKQPERDRQLVLGHNSDCLACLSHLYIGDKDRRVVRSPSLQSLNRGRTRTSNGKLADAYYDTIAPDPQDEL
jgi:hypothetical protein